MKLQIIGGWNLRQAKRVYWGASILLNFCDMAMKLRGYFLLIYPIFCTRNLVTINIGHTSYAQNTIGVWRLWLGKKSIVGKSPPKLDKILDWDIWIFD